MGIKIPGQGTLEGDWDLSKRGDTGWEEKPKLPQCLQSVVCTGVDAAIF